MQGPYPIFCRGHSGGRLLCEAFIRNGINMGQVARERQDTEFFAIHNPLIRELILNAYHYPHAEPKQRLYYQALMKQCIDDFRRQEIHQPGPFGWKLGISLFTLLVLLDALPTAKVIHLIRDGRDVMLSRLEARFAHLDDPVNKLVVFGQVDSEHFAGQPLTSEVIARYRNELEMLHWVTAVRYGLNGRAYPGRYLEVHYEAICAQPLYIFSQIFDFLEVPFLATTQKWVQQAVHQSRIGKWQSLSAQQLEKPLAIGAPLLKQLGYLE